MSKLNKLFFIKKDIDEIKEQIEELTELSSKALTGMPMTPRPGNPVQQFVERKIKLQEKLIKKLNIYIIEKEKIEDVIEKVDDPEIKVIARMRYINNMDYDEIGKELFQDRTTVSRKLKKYFEKE